MEILWQTGSGGGGSGTGFDGVVQVFSDLPVDDSADVGEVWLVRESEGAWFFGRKQRGLYQRIDDTGVRETDWQYLGEWQEEFSDDNFQVYNASDTSKVVKLDVSTVATATTRTLTVPNEDGTIALMSDVVDALNDAIAYTDTQIAGLSSVYQPLDGDLTAIAALSGTGYARRTGTSAWALDSFVPASRGGTGFTSYAEGDLLYGNAGGALSKLAAPGLPGYVLAGSSTVSWVQLSTLTATTITGTANQVLVNGTSGSAQTGPITLTLPQSIATTSSVSFGSATLPGSTTDSTLKVGAFELQSFAVSNMWFGNNFYFDGTNFKYRANGFATAIYFDTAGGLHARVTTSGTAAGNITWTRPFQINNDGSIGLGGNITTAGSLTGAAATVTSTGFQGPIGISTPAAAKFTSVGMSSVLTITDTGTYFIRLNQTAGSGKEWGMYSETDGSFRMDDVGGATRFILTTTGINFTAIGATGQSTGAFTQVLASGTNTNPQDASDGTTFGTALRSGYILTAQVGDAAIFANRNGSNGDLMVMRRSGASVGTISVTTTATAYNTSSDRRLKTNIRRFRESGAIIDAIKPCIHDWKSGEKDSIGFVAQELYSVYPAAVTKGDDNASKIEQRWAIDYSKMVPVIVAELQSLRERVGVLEKA